MSAWVRSVLLTAALTWVVALTGCTSSAPEPGAEYTPVPDEEIFARIRALPGVVEADLAYVDDFSHGNGYVGMVEVTPRTDRAETLDAVNELLWQGHSDVELRVSVVHAGGTPLYAHDAFGLWDRDDYVDRYGEQPGYVSGRERPAPDPSPTG